MAGSLGIFFNEQYFSAHFSSFMLCLYDKRTANRLPSFGYGALSYDHGYPFPASMPKRLLFLWKKIRRKQFFPLCLPLYFFTPLVYASKILIPGGGRGSSILFLYP